MDEDLSSICRVCFGGNGGFYCLADELIESDGQKYTSEMMLYEFGATRASECPDNVILPLMICVTCSDELVQSFLFHQKVQKSNERISEIVCAKLYKDEGTEMSEANEVNEEEVEYTEANDPELEENITQEDDIGDLTDGESDMLEAVMKATTWKNGRGKKGPKRTKSSTKTQPLRLNANVEGNSFIVSGFIPSNDVDASDPKISKVEITEDGVEKTVTQVVDKVKTFDFAAIELKNLDSLASTIGPSRSDSTDGSNRSVYACQYCPQAFATSDYLLAHSRAFHVCQHCTQAFKQRQELHKHIREFHKDFSCAICGREFKSSSSLRVHTRKFHNVELPAHVSLLSFSGSEKRQKIE